MFDIEGFVAECRAALSESSPALATKEVVERAIRDPEAIDAALGVPAHGGLRALHS